MFWGGREGYETLLNTDMGLEQDNMARLMRMAVEYARKIGFTGDFYIEPQTVFWKNLQLTGYRDSRRFYGYYDNSNMP